MLTFLFHILVSAKGLHTLQTFLKLVRNLGGGVGMVCITVQTHDEYHHRWWLLLSYNQGKSVHLYGNGIPYQHLNQIP